MVASEEASRKFDFSLFPNPAVNWLKLSYSGTGNLQYQVLDIRGRHLQGGEFQGETILQLHGMPDGLYFLQLRDQLGTTEVYKMMKHASY